MAPQWYAVKVSDTTMMPQGTEAGIKKNLTFPNNAKKDSIGTYFCFL
jgi:hypothetical protein